MVLRFGQTKAACGPKRVGKGTEYPNRANTLVGEVWLTLWEQDAQSEETKGEEEKE